MKRPLTLPALLLVLTALAGCGDDEGPATASDPAGAPGGTSGTGGTETPAEPTMPSDVPAADGPVRTPNLATVMDTGDGAELCLGPIAESYPPQCSGPAITNWDWASQAGMFEKQGDVRWGTFVVTGAWDGTAVTVSDVIPGPLYDPAPTEPVELPEPARDYPMAELEQIAGDLGASLPGAQGAYADTEGHVLVDVTFDDGTLQEYVDAVHGTGVVVVTGALVDVEA